MKKGEDKEDDKVAFGKKKEDNEMGDEPEPSPDEPEVATPPRDETGQNEHFEIDDKWECKPGPKPPDMSYFNCRQCTGEHCESDGCDIGQHCEHEEIRMVVTNQCQHQDAREHPILEEKYPCQCPTV